MGKMGFAAIAVAVSLMGAAPAGAASLLTSSGGYTGPILDLGVYGGQSYTYSAGPLSLPGGITYSAQSESSVLGIGGYGLNANGVSENTDIIGTNTDTTFVTLEFDTAVAMFGGGFNYATADGNGTPLYAAVIIRAFDDDDMLIAEYDIGDLAPIATPNAVDAFAFRGIDGGGRLIKRFEFGGSYAIMAARGTDSVVPEPGTWALMILGFGAAGAMLRRRGLALTAA